MIKSTFKTDTGQMSMAGYYTTNLILLKLLAGGRSYRGTTSQSQKAACYMGKHKTQRTHE